MKNSCFSIAALLFFVVAKAQVVSIPDATFRGMLFQASTTSQIAQDINGNNMKIDVNNNFVIEVSEALSVYKLTLPFATVHSLTGIEAFTNLTYFRCDNIAGNDAIPTLDVRPLTHLQYLYCSSNSISTLLVDGLSNLKELSISSNDLTSINFSGLTSLQFLYCNSNPHLAHLDLTPLTSLQTVFCAGNILNSLNISGLNDLLSIQCYGNQLASLDVSAVPNLITLECSQNVLTNLNLGTLNNLTNLYIEFNALTAVDLSGCNNLEYLDCYYNQLASINVSNLSHLQHFSCLQNQLTTLDLNGLANLTYFSCSSNHMNSILMHDIGYDGSAGQNLAFSQNPNLLYICTNESKIPLVEAIADGYGYTECSVVDCLLGTVKPAKNAPVAIYPNPAANELNVMLIKESTIIIYNMLGQSMLTFPNINGTKSLDITSLKTGNYIINVNSDSENWHKKFLKI